MTVKFNDMRVGDYFRVRGSLTKNLPIVYLDCILQLTEVGLGRAHLVVKHSSNKCHTNRRPQLNISVLKTSIVLFQSEIDDELVVELLDTNVVEKLYL